MAQVSRMASTVTQENRLLAADNQRLTEQREQQAQAIRQLQVRVCMCVLVWEGTGREKAGRWALQPYQAHCHTKQLNVCRGEGVACCSTCQQHWACVVQTAKPLTMLAPYGRLLVM